MHVIRQTMHMLTNPALATEAPRALDVAPDSDDDWNALLDAHDLVLPAHGAAAAVAQSANAAGAPVTSAAAACASPSTAPCGERSERPRKLESTSMNSGAIVSVSWINIKCASSDHLKW